jgi:hypothetical protein
MLGKQRFDKHFVKICTLTPFSLPKPVEAEEELDFLASDDFAHRFHGALAARTFEWIATPDFQYEVTPQGAHVAGGLFGRGGDEEDLGRGI